MHSFDLDRKYFTYFIDAPDLGLYSEYEFEPISICPYCEIAISPIIDGYFCNKINDRRFVTFLCSCPVCYKTFIVKYELSSNDRSTLINYALTSSIEKTFDPKLEVLSPDFVRIYNQSLRAKELGMSDICGLGFRKALEFLIKDYAILLNKEDKDKIERLNLGPCIREYIDNPKICTLAERSVWLGNDQTHYVEKHSDRDVNDLIKFIDRIVFHISGELVDYDASSIQPIK